jgi:uncharacterized membrane-anchored protein YitT (DUF2179 family)
VKRLLREALNGLLLTLGALCAAMGLHGFLLPSGFVDGGVTGVSMLLAQATGLPLYVLLPLINLPFILLGYRHLGLAFAVRSTLAIAGLAVALATVPFPDVTPDLLLTAVFGGFFIGAGIGLAIRGGGVLDGTEVVALLVSKRYDHMKVSDVVLGLNAVIFLAALLLLGVEAALYSILTYAAAAKTLDSVILGIEEHTAITIISARSAEIRVRLVAELGRGLTVYRGVGGASGKEQEILYCVVTRLEIGKVREVVRAEDEGAFVVTHLLAAAEGGTLGRTAQH